MKSILFVCTGNTCRSSMAEALFKKLLEDKGISKYRFKISSAGTCAWDGDNASPQAIQVLEEKGIDIRNHLSTPLTPKLIKETDLILTMTVNHKMGVEQMRPKAKGKVFTLKEYVLNNGKKLEKSKVSFEEANDDIYDIRDPFGQPVEVYSKCVEEIEEYLHKLVEKII